MSVMSYGRTGGEARASVPKRRRGTVSGRAPRGWALASAFLALWALAAPGARAADTGFTTASNVPFADPTWNDMFFMSTFTVGNLSAVDGAYAININGNGSWQDGQLSAFPFGIPTGATISGIEVVVVGSSSTAGSLQYQVGVSWDNGSSWTDRIGTFTGTFNTTTTFGSATDLWGHTPWTPAEVNGSFRVHIYRIWPFATPDLRIDQVAVRVTYQVAQTLSPSGFMRVRSGTYTGNGGIQAFNVGFQPDLVVVISGANCANIGTYGCGHDTVMRSSTMGAGNVSKATNLYAYGLLANRITSLTATGFTVGEPANHNATNDDPTKPYHCVNHSGVTYYWVAFKGAPGEMELGTYTGTGATTRDPVSPALTFQPDYVLVLPGNGDPVFQRTANMPADTSYDLVNANYCAACPVARQPAIRTMQPNGFTVGPKANVSGVTYHYVAWKAVAGRTAVGTYTGNNSDNRSFTGASGAGFQPEYLSVTRGTPSPPGTTTNVKVGATGAGTDLSLLYYYQAASGSPLNATNRIQALLTDGFQVGTSVDVNALSQTYYWVAFAGANPSGSPTTNYRSIGSAGVYFTGTVAVTNGSKTVTGSGTQTWLTSKRGTGDVITINSVNYTVARVLSETQLELVQAYAGATNSSIAYQIRRQFSTLQAWEDCISKATTCTYFPVASANLAADNRVEVGVAFPDSDFTFPVSGTSPLVIDGSITGPGNTITLTSDLRYRHKGLLNTGPRITNLNNNAPAIAIRDDHVTVEWIEVYWGNIDGITVGSPTSTDNKILLRYNLLHDVSQTTVTGGTIVVESPYTSLDAYNNFLQQVYGDGFQLDPGASWAATSVIRLLNNTVRFTTNAPTRKGFKSLQSSNASVLLRNNIGDNRGVSSWGTGFDVPSLNSASSHNMSSLPDTTGPAHSPAGGGLQASANFVSSSDTHLQAGSGGVNQGADLSALMPALDIDAEVRPAGAAWDIGADEYSATTAVRLAFLRAVGLDSAVSVEWETATELDNLGFHLYRGPSESGPWERLTETLIPGASSSLEGRSYAYLDSGLQNGATWSYRLEDLDRSGRATSHGPVSATPRAGATPPGGGEESPPGDGGGAATPPPAWTAHGDPSDVSLRVLSRSTSSITLELRTGGFYSFDEDDGPQRLYVPGFFDLAEPGYPSLPTRRTWAEAVVGLGARVASVSAEDTLSFDGLVPARAGVPQSFDLRDGTQRAGFRPAAAARLSRALYPRAPARVVETAFQGDTKKACIELTPLRFDPTRGRLVLARRLVVTVVFDGVVPGEVSLGGSSGRRFPPRRRAPEGELLLARFSTRAPGLHAVAWEDLVAATSSPEWASNSMLDTSTLRLSRLGVAVPFHVEPRHDRFGPGSTLFFLSEGPGAAYGTEAVYELAVAAGGLRMGLGRGRSVTPAGPLAPLASLLASLQVEQNLDYVPGILSAPDPWIWSGFLSGSGADYTFSLDAPAPGAARIRVQLLGASDTAAEVDHAVSVSLGNVSLGEARWDGLEPFSFEADVPDGVLQEGTNTLRLDGVGEPSSAVYLDRFSLDYPHALAAAGGRLEGVATGDGLVEAAGFDPGSFLFDLSGRRPRFLGRFLSSVVFAAEKDHRYLVVSPQALLRPVIRPVGLSSLRDTSNQADWIVIAPEELLPAAETLRLHRQDQGLASLAVSLEEVYSEFGFGEASPDAVRDFLAYAYHQWAAPAPRYVLLLGDASYDPKGFFTGASHGDLLPSPIIRSSFLWTASDPLYASVNGDDILPDVAIGRITAGSLFEAQGAIQKILDFEDASRSLSGKAVLVADDPDPDAGDFELNADDIATLLPSREVQKIFLTELGPSTKATLVGAFDSGASLVSYIGHGSQVLWGSAWENIFRAPDVDLLQPGPDQPLVLTMTCSNGYFISPWTDAIAERLTLAPDRGAIAAFSPSGLSLDEAAHVYHRALVSELEGGAHQRLGDLVLAAQARYLQTGAFPELLSLYHLFGDPALAVR